MRVRLLVGIFIAGSLAVGSIRYAANSSEHKPQEHSPKPQDEISWSGSIAGYVVDVEGRPMHNAKVYACFSDAPMGKMRYVLTDAQGGFLIEGLRPGRHTVSAAKEDEGYPLNDIPFYYSKGAAGGAESPEVIVNAEQTTSGVVVCMGPKAAKLAAHVVDAMTGEPVRAHITLSRVDHPEYTLSFSVNLDGEFEKLIPPAPVEIKVSAPSYEDWNNMDTRANSYGRALHLAESETKKLSISLQRIR